MQILLLFFFFFFEDGGVTKVFAFPIPDKTQKRGRNSSHFASLEKSFLASLTFEAIIKMNYSEWLHEGGGGLFASCPQFVLIPVGLRQGMLAFCQIAGIVRLYRVIEVWWNVNAEKLVIV